MFELPTQRAMAARQNDRGAGKEGRAILHPSSLGRLTRGVDLLLSYVDLRYGRSFEELAHLSQRPDRREVAPISLVQPLLMEAALSDGHTTFLGHAARVEALKELNLEPGGHDPLGKKPL
jgi:hypothetical protein